MRNIYITVAALFILSLVLFVASFVYLDNARHATYYYTINHNGHDVGSIRIDRFVTEDKLLYKSAAATPFQPFFTNLQIRMVFGQKRCLDEYFRELSGGGIKEMLYLKNDNGKLAFLSVFDAQFAYLDNMPFRKNTFVFKEDAPVTYLPIIESYDFRRGKSQGFNAITNFSPDLPPMYRFVTLTSIADEYLEVDSRDIKTEHLLLKIKNYSQGSVWVAKSDKSIIKIELPGEGLRITRSFKPRAFEAVEYIRPGDRYTSEDVEFKSGNIMMAGTLTIPKGEGKRPAFLLIPGKGPQDRQYMGLFESMAGSLADSGYCVMRFDKSGVGQSDGNAASSTLKSEIDDARNALLYLAARNEVDAGNIFITAHAEGAAAAVAAASQGSNVKGVILMAPLLDVGFDQKARTDNLKAMATELRWTNEYLKLAVKSAAKTIEKVKSSKGNWSSLFGYRCFLKKIRDGLEFQPMGELKEVKAPVLILQGKEDEPLFLKSSAIIDKALAEQANFGHELIYFGYLGHFFGAMINDGMRRAHYEIDPAVTESMVKWLGRLKKAEAEAPLPK